MSILDRTIKFLATAIAFFFLVSCAQPETLLSDWRRLSTEQGALPVPSLSTQQTACLLFDINNDGLNDFVIAGRDKKPSVVWYQRLSDGWAKHVIDPEQLHIEAGGAYHDIDGDGDLDIVFGGDYRSDKVWWWENPYPDYEQGKPWKRRIIKDSGANQHHDEIFGDFDGDGDAELVFWNQGAGTLCLAEIPRDVKNVGEWKYFPIYHSPQKSEGLAKVDMNGDGVMNIVGGGCWFERNMNNKFVAHVIDENQRGARVAVGSLKQGARPQVVMVQGDGVGPLKWYEWSDHSWKGHDLLGFDVNHGHSLEVADINGDGALDIFCGEMRLDGRNKKAKIWVFYGNGKGDFSVTQIARGFGVHESKVGDLDGDGDMDILGKPYNWETPRLDIWLNEQGKAAKLSLDRWERHVVDDKRPYKAVFIDAKDLNGDRLPEIVTGGWWYKNPGSANGHWERKDIGYPLFNMATVYDFNADGAMDVLGTKGKGAQPNDSFVWARNDGQGNFVLHENVSRGSGDFLQGVAVGPFQANKNIQAALSWHHAGEGVQLLTVPNSPDREPWPLQKISATSQDECLSAGDIDTDGDLDLLLGTKWLRNDGSSWTAFTLTDTKASPDRNRLSDINGDGKLDAVVGFEAISKKGKLSWYEQGKSPTARWKEHEIAEIIGPMSLDVADMDNDGDIDVVAGEHNLKNPSQARLFVFENLDGKGGRWSEHLVYRGDEHHDGARVVDIDNDGDQDIISIGWGSPKVLLYENKAIDKR